MQFRITTRNNKNVVCAIVQIETAFLGMHGRTSFFKRERNVPPSLYPDPQPSSRKCYVFTHNNLHAVYKTSSEILLNWIVPYIFQTFHNSHIIAEINVFMCINSRIVSIEISPKLG